ncbi:hypothetical protein [Nocardiopsis potens]|uniref:hypothetical protein n=1 Tax=Nocardiopsis potens TaxID=1246458 RepID=UPI00034D2A9F|nr:hypothetical protein [Nocardiopsis potens]
MTTETEGSSRGGGTRTGRRTAPRTRPAAPPRTAPRTARARRPAAPASRPPRMPFVLLVLGLLAGALISLLALRTVLLEDSFAISRLQSENTELGHEQERLEEEVVRLEAPERIAREAEEMGMEPGEAPEFLHMDEGRVSGGGGE